MNGTAERLSAQSPQRAGYLLTLDDALEVSRALFEPVFNEARPRLKHRGLWIKVKCLHGDEFVVVGWTDPEGTRPYLGALLLGYYDSGGRLIYAGRAGTGIKQAELQRLWRRLPPARHSR